MDEHQCEALAAATQIIRDADALLILAGAGMGVDSGLPDFRGTEGFWNAYPPFASLGLRFEQLANPIWFAADNELAWGFYGHRLNLYRITEPHAGFAILRRWGERKRNGAFVFTSNVDGHFQKSGFSDDCIAECHGSIHYLQCCIPCSDQIWDAAGTTVEVDAASMRAKGPLPSCPNCSAPARPNVLMFSDQKWLSQRAANQLSRYNRWLEKAQNGNLVLIEFGAGTTLARVRSESEWVARRTNASLIRINVREADVPSGPHVGIALAALPAIRAIDDSGVL